MTGCENEPTLAQVLLGMSLNQEWWEGMGELPGVAEGDLYRKF